MSLFWKSTSAIALAFLVLLSEGCGGGSAAVAPASAVRVSISPGSAWLFAGQPATFTATVTGSSNVILTWEVSGVAGGNGTVGTITATGLYTAPVIPPSPNTISITATSAADPSQSASAKVTITNPVPALYSISPNAATAGAPDTALTVDGTGFTAQSVVYFGSTALATVFGSATQLSATIPSPMLVSTGTFSIAVATPAPGGGRSTSLNLTIWPGYPRNGAGSVLEGPPPALLQVAQNGTLVSVLDWTSKDNEGDSEDVISADHVLAEMGIPNIDTADFTTAAANPFLVVAGVLNTGSSLSPTDVSNIKSYVNAGGTLYLWEPNVSGLLAALGISSPPNDYMSLPDEQRPLSFDTSQNDPLLKYIDAPEEINWAPFFPVSDVTRGYSSS